MPVRHIIVRTLSRRATRGRLIAGNFSFPCALGRSGATHIKREGDGASPKGRFSFERLYTRVDKHPRPRMGKLTPSLIRAEDGWCDEPRDRNYNRFVRHPYPASAERLHRTDDLYDVILVLGHNQRPRLRGRGSAIFMHIARPGFLPTEGCIALRKRDLLKIVPLIGRRTRIII